MNHYFFVLFVPFVVNTLFEKTKPILGKNKRKKALSLIIYDLLLIIFLFISVNPRLMTISWCKFVVNLKKQSQFVSY